MTDRELEQKIKTAVEHAAPDRLWNILTRCEEQEQAAPARTSLRDSVRDRIAGLSRPRFPYSRIILDVNPSVCLEVDEEETVLSAEALNEDGAGLLSGLCLTGRPLPEAVDALIGAMLQDGCLSEVQNSILVSVENADAQKQETLRARLSGMIEERVNENLDGTGEGASVLSQTMDPDDELADLAGTYGVSLGKAALIRKLVEEEDKEKDGEDAPLTFGELAPLSVNDIALLTADHVTDGSVTRVGRPSEKAYIGQSAALKAALSYAGLSFRPVKKYKVKLDSYKSRMVYEVKLKTTAGKVKYSLDARTGDMVRRKKDIKTAPGAAADERRTNMSKKMKYNYRYNPTGNTGAYSPVPKGAIGEEAAKAAALKDAGITENDVPYVRTRPDWKHGWLKHYDVKFVYGGRKYKYAVGVFDGAVLKRKMKDRTAKNFHGTSCIGHPAALQSALSYAGLQLDQVGKYKVKTDSKWGRKVYKVKMKTAAGKVKYLLDAHTGDMVRRKKDIRIAPAAPRMKGEIV